MWECGLKHLYLQIDLVGAYVTPYVGVWIETLKKYRQTHGKYCHSLCGSVD